MWKAIIWGIIILLAIYLINQVEEPAEPYETPEKIVEVSMIGGNSLIAVSPPSEIRPQSLGMIIDKVVECESGWDNSAAGKAGEVGIAQFKPQTWEWMSGLAGIELDINSAEDQLWLLEWGLLNDYGNHWTCYRRLGI